MNRPKDCCKGKARHKSPGGAIIALKRVNHAQLDLYRCPKCHCWHIGKSKKPEKIQARFDQLLAPVAASLVTTNPYPEERLIKRRRK